MKNVFLFAVLCFCIVSCKKADNPSVNNNNNNSNNNPAPLSYVSSIWVYSAPNEIVDSFTYDTSHHIAVFAQYMYDSTRKTFNDRIADTYSFSGTDTVPSSYIQTYLSISGLMNVTHDLSYDSQNRIIKDTALDGSGFVIYFSYSLNSITSTVLFEGTTADEQISVSDLSNGNVSSTSIQGSGLQTGASFGYSTYANPAYNPAVANTIGPLLFLQSFDGYGGYQDFISQKLVVSGNGITLQVKTDSLGRAIYAYIPVVSGNENFHYQ
jgi:hypothetical protein